MLATQLETDAPDRLDMDISAQRLKLGAKVANVGDDGFLVRNGGDERGVVGAAECVEFALGEDAVWVFHERGEKIELGAGQPDRCACHRERASLRREAPGAKGEHTLLRVCSALVFASVRGRCAALRASEERFCTGGKFIEVMANRLGVTIDEIFDLAAVGKPIPISSLCTVFAESEVIGLLAKGADKNSICLGLLDSVAQRAANLLSRVSDDGDICFTGGCAQNRLLARLIEQKTGRRVITPEKAQFAGALGAAVMEAVR